jgi:hypothetical protein
MAREGDGKPPEEEEEKTQSILRAEFFSPFIYPGVIDRDNETGRDETGRDEM